MAVEITYKANNSDFRKLMMSDQTQDLADEAADHGVAVARLYATGSRPQPPADYIAAIKAAKGPMVTLLDGGFPNPRRTSRVVIEHRLAGIIEFGSGQKPGKGRPQGGSSTPHRVLGRTGARIGAGPRKKS